MIGLLVSRIGKTMAPVTIKRRLVAAVETTVAISNEAAVHREVVVVAWATNSFKHLSHRHFHNTSKQVEITPPQREEVTRSVVLVVIMVVVVGDVAAKAITTTTMTDMT